MVADKVAKELRSALDAMKAERAELDSTIQDLERLLSKYGVKRGPGRPPGSSNKSSGAKRGPGRPKGSGKKKSTKKKVGKRKWTAAQKKAQSEKLKKAWERRRKKG